MANETTIKFDDCGHLLCPECGGEYLHIESLDAYAAGSDLDYKFDCREGGMRGGGARFTLWCEFCHAKPILHIQHHKGNTYIFHTGVEGGKR